MIEPGFDESYGRVLVYEGGFSNHPRDPGGATNKGVTQRVYDGYRRRKGLSTQSVRYISNAETREIYREQYWDAARCNALPVGVNFAVFDGAVNSGVGQSVKWLQRALAAGGYYHGPIDGDCGIGTIAGAQAHGDHDRLIADMLARRLGMLQSLKTWSDFGKGWSKRVSSTLAIAQAWASGSVGPQPAYVVDLAGQAKGYAGDVTTASISQTAGTNTAAGGTGAVALLQSASSTIAPYADASPIITKIFIGLTLLSAAVAIGGAISAFVSSRQNKRAQAAIDGEIVADLRMAGA